MSIHTQPWLRKASIVFLLLFNLPLTVLIAYGTEMLTLQIGWWAVGVIFFVLMPACVFVSIEYPWWELFLLTHIGTMLTSVIYTSISYKNTDGSMAVYALVTWHFLFAINYCLDLWKKRR